MWGVPEDMTTQAVIFTVIGLIVVLAGIAAWLYDARRNKRVADDEERFDQPRKRRS
jgi:LPXTG-motif cell wall-anchored protein